MGIDIRQLAVSRLGAQGDGIAATLDGPIYVAGALPGEVVRAQVAGNRGRCLELLSQSADRIRPVCRHFGACGGCAAQHMQAGLYRAWKRQIVSQAFEHRGLDVEVDDVLTIPPGTRRRAVFAAMRTETGVVLGYHKAGSPALIDVEQCPVLLPAIVAALPGLRTIAIDVAPVGGEMRITVTAMPNGLDVAFGRLRRKLTPSQQARVARLAASMRLARLSIGDDVIALLSPPSLDLGGVSVAPPPGAFLQASREAETLISDLVVTSAGKAKRAADLFCGLGTFTFPLARSACVLAVDGNDDAIAALREAAKRASGLKTVEAKVRDLIAEPLSRRELAPFDAVVFDPPHSGARAQAEALAKSNVPVVIAVSCNPATLARDARILVDGAYRLERVAPIDQFVFSAEVEAVAVFRRS